ncbi:MAG: DedA family protein [Rhabdochlamydiaceae bacterium]
MTELIVNFIQEHIQYAHWVFFFSLLLAGLNIPISSDAIVISSALIAAKISPQHTLRLYLSIFLGSLFSAWISYSIGRLIGPYLQKNRIFRKILSENRLSKIKDFYSKYGFWSLIIGRFIPFGFRNCLFMSSGFTGLPFFTFIWRDLIACFIWSFSLFNFIYHLGQNYLVLYDRSVYILCFMLLMVAVGVVSFFIKKQVKKLKT